jgi:hypothetical protein
MMVEENGFEGDQESYHYANDLEELELAHMNHAHPTVGNANGTPTPSSTEQLLDSLRPSPIDQEDSC